MNGQKNSRAKILVSACLVGERVRYDGSFTGVSEAGKGVTVALFEENGVRVFSEHQMAEANSYLKGFAGKVGD